MDIAAMDVQTIIDRQPLSRFQFGLLTICFLITLLDGYDAQVIGFAIGAMANDWHVERAAFGAVFSVGFAGLLIGALMTGIVADKFGRKPVLALSTFLFGIFSLMTAYSDSVNQLLVFRFLTGLGVGGAVPNTIAYIGEWTPKSRRVTAMTLIGAGVSVGAALAGLIASQLLVITSWRLLFIIGGVAPLLLSLLILFCLPESLRFLVLKSAGQEATRRLVARAHPASEDEVRKRGLMISEPSGKGMPVTRLFSEGSTAGTILLWIAFFFNVTALYTLIPWLPTMLAGIGLNVSAASIAASSFSIGGIIGGLSFGRMIDKRGARAILVAGHMSGALATALIGVIGPNPVLLGIIVFAAGFAIAGSQHGANAYAGSIYPTSVRSTGVGWAMGIGRIGSVLGPYIAGQLLAQEWALSSILNLYAIGILASAILYFLMRQPPQKAFG